ncbi:MAG: MIP family channel protein [Elusimicrobiota bacterium]
MLPAKLQKYLAEFLATFFLVFVGTGSIIVNELAPIKLNTLSVSLVFGFIVLAMIYTVGHISGAHMNPAVTLSFALTKKFPWRETPLYILAQILGATLASLTIKFIFNPTFSNLGATVPAFSQAQAFWLEYFSTLLLMFVIMGVATDHRAEGVMAGVAIGGTVSLLAIFAGPISGASMNPARSFGPALISGHWNGHYIYWLAPILGAFTGAFFYQQIRCVSKDPSSHGCC